MAAAPPPPVFVCIPETGEYVTLAAAQRQVPHRPPPPRNLTEAHQAFLRAFRPEDFPGISAIRGKWHTRTATHETGNHNTDEDGPFYHCWGHGDPAARLVVLVDGASADDVRCGQAICDTDQAWQSLAAVLPPDLAVWRTAVIKAKVDGDQRDVAHRQLAYQWWVDRLVEELSLVRPTTIVAIGRYAADLALRGFDVAKMEVAPTAWLNGCAVPTTLVGKTITASAQCATPDATRIAVRNSQPPLACTVVPLMHPYQVQMSDSATLFAGWESSVRWAADNAGATATKSRARMEASRKRGRATSKKAVAPLARGQTTIPGVRRRPQ